jgi:subtilisin family serine protease
VRLPVQSYRLVVAYADLEDRKSIEEIIANVVATRARQLRVDRSQIAIDVTVPIGSARVQSGFVCLPPGQPFVPPPKTMKYPFMYPYSDGSAWAKETQLPKVAVGVWDTHVDVSHCALNGAGKSIVHPTAANMPSDIRPPDRTDACGEARDPSYRLRPRYDHGTAIVGILAGQGAGVSGVAPNLLIWAYELFDAAQIERDGDPILKWYRSEGHELKAINISQTFDLKTPSDESNTNLRSLILGSKNRTQGWHSSIVFVAAAGVGHDQGYPLGRQIDEVSSFECNVYPACWSNDSTKPKGLISVVALNNRGDDLLRDDQGRPVTNYGVAFDVAAVGETKSAYHGNYVGPVCGSSFAAAYVTGAAALIYAKLKANQLGAVSTNKVKERILFTADRIPPLDGFSRFGRINYEKALAYEQDFIDYKRSPQCATEHCWTPVEINRDIEEDIVVTSAKENGNIEVSEFKIPFNRVRSLMSEGDGRFTVRWVDEAGRLRTIDNANIRMTGSKIVRIKNQAFPFDPSAIQSFISCSFLPQCE